MEFLPAPTGASTGAMPPSPVAYGQYEIGRSKHPSRKSPFTSPPFKDGMAQSWQPGANQWPLPLPPQGDPGAYDPYYYEDAGTNPTMNSSSKNRKPFDATEVRQLRANLFGIETPSIGQYPVFQPEKTLGELDDNMRYPKQDANVSVFNSGSKQRPNAKSAVPAPDTYTPNPNAIMAAVGDPGMHMRGSEDRFAFTYNKRFVGMTDEVVGPGSYDQFEKTLAEDCDLAIQRSSRIKPGFGTTSPSRGLPFFAQGTPAPGCYEPVEPRLKSLTGEARRQVM